ncbi:unnamed protein product [Alopecurus aequalis]
MEESISSSGTADASFIYGDVHCYASGGPHATAEASEDSGWTDYFYDDDGGDNCPQLQASEEEPASPAPREKHSHRHAHSDRASASVVSTASKSKKEVTKEEKKKKRPRRGSAGEDPLQDTASSLPANAAREVQLQDGWQIACCCEQKSVDRLLKETQMGLPGGARCRKEAYLYILSPT